MQTLTIEKGNEVLRFNPLINGEIEISQQIFSREGGNNRRLTPEKSISIIPKSERARIAHFLVTGEAIE